MFARRIRTLSAHLCAARHYTLTAAPELASGSSIKVDLFAFEGKRAGQGCVLTLGKGPVNSLDTAFFKEMDATCRLVSADDRVQSVVLASAFPKVFSAGLDFTPGVLVSPEEESFKAMWHSFQSSLATLHNLPKPLVVAVNGVAPAGGTVLALAGDYRLATPKCSMGLTEAAIGLVPPRWLDLMCQSAVGEKGAMRMLTQSRMLTSGDECLSFGLVDEVAESDDLDALRERACAVAEQLGGQWTTQSAVMKRRFRAETTSFFNQAGIDETWEYVKGSKHGGTPDFENFVTAFLSKKKKR